LFCFLILGYNFSFSGTSKDWKSFEYSIPWNNVDLSIMNKLNATETKGGIADISDLVKLRKWLMTDLYKSYESFKENYYVKTKTPGVQVYESVATQVTQKFKSIKDMSDGFGYGLFLQTFTHSMENRGRRAKEVDVMPPLLRPSRAVQTKGTPGVIEQEYNPNISEDDQQEQEKYRITLQTISRSSRPKTRDIQNITKLMHQSYELQRKYITKALQKISETDPDQGKTIEIK